MHKRRQVCIQKSNDGRPPCATFFTGRQFHSLVILIVMSTFVYLIRAQPRSRSHSSSTPSRTAKLCRRAEMDAYQLSFNLVICYLMIHIINFLISSVWIVMYLVSCSSQPAKTVRVQTNDD